MDTLLKSLMEEFGVTNEKELLQKKAEGKQTRYTMNAQKPKLVEMTADQCKRLCDKAGIEYQSGYENRILEGVTTNEVTDRYGDIVRYKGIGLDNFMKNPVVMLSHEHANFPVGNSLQIRKESSIKGIISQDLYIDDRVDSSGRADLAFNFRRSGFMPGISIGFIPIKSKFDHTQDEKTKIGLGKYGIEFLEIDYLEHSQVSIPANPEALSNALKSIEKRSIRKEDIMLMEKLKFYPDNLLNIFEDFIQTGKSIFVMSDFIKTLPVLRPYPNEHACRLNDPKKYDKFRRGTRKHEDKTYSIIFGHIEEGDTWEEQAYRYDKEEWETASAQAHCKDHKGKFDAATGEKMILDDGTVLIHGGDNIWKEVPQQQKEQVEEKLDTLIKRIESLTETLTPPKASESKDPEVDERLYDGEILRKFNLEPKI